MMWVLYGIIVAVVVVVVLVMRSRLKPPPPSGFLDDYSRLQKDPQLQGLLWWSRTDVDWEAFEGILLQPVEVRLHPRIGETRAQRVDPEVLKELAGRFHEVVTDELEGHYSLRDAAAGKALRIRSAVTDVKLSNPWINILTVLTVLIPVNFGGASMEAEFLDGDTDEALGAVVARGMGSPLHVMPHSLASEGHAVDTFKRWAKLLRASLEEVDFPRAAHRDNNSDI